MRRTVLLTVMLALVSGCQSTTQPAQPSKPREHVVTIRGEVRVRSDITIPPGARLQVAVRMGQYGPLEKELVFENVRSWPVEYEFVLPEEHDKEGDYVVMANAFTNGQLTHLAPERSSYGPSTSNRWVSLELIPVRE